MSVLIVKESDAFVQMLISVSALSTLVAKVMSMTRVLPETVFN